MKFTISFADYAGQATIYLKYHNILVDGHIPHPLNECIISDKGYNQKKQNVYLGCSSNANAAAARCKQNTIKNKEMNPFAAFQILVSFGNPREYLDVY